MKLSRTGCHLYLLLVRSVFIFGTCTGRLPTVLARITGACALCSDGTCTVHVLVRVKYHVYACTVARRCTRCRMYQDVHGCTPLQFQAVGYCNP